MDSKRKLVPISRIYEKTDLTPEEQIKLDIYRFMEIQCIRPFRFRELANWLMENNYRLKNEFIGSSIPKSYRVHKKTSFIKARFKPFFDRGYVVEEKIKSLKNDTDTSSFSLTGKGLIHLYEMKTLVKDYKNNSDDLELRESILDYIQTTLIDSVRDNFYSVLIRRMHEVNSPFFSNLSNSYMSTEPRNRLTSLMFFPFFPNSSELLEVNYDSIEDKELTSAILQYGEIILKTLNDLDEETKSLLLLELKRELEHAYLLLYPTREFEISRFQNYANNNQIAVQTKCILCQSFSAAIVNSIDLIKIYFSRTKKIHSLSCSKCAPGKNNKTCRIMRPDKVS